MKRVFLVLLSLTTVACGNLGTPKLSWSSDTVTRIVGRSMIDMKYPVAIGGKVADSVNAAILDVVKFGLSDQGFSTQDKSVAALVDTLFARKQRDTVISHIPYVITVSGSVFEKDRLLSVYINKDSYTGGAHGNIDSRYLNFNRKTGAQLKIDQLFSDTTALSVINITAFKQYLASKEIANVASLLFVEVDKLPLPKNIGLDSAGVVMLYNQYEIAPYYFGQSRYTIPYADVDKILNTK